mmetsp:Transcript_24251/g.27749  ORF Transcript_24251/g.27749 Transcript_24251/m.27749 type:complete len:84 (-) Transcript_24251:33-284(-)
MPNDDDQDDHDSAPAPDNTTRVTTIRSTRTADERRHCSFVRGSTKVVLSNKATATATANANASSEENLVYEYRHTNVKSYHAQ